MAQGAVPPSVTQLLETFSELPGIGPKTASRLAFYLLRGRSELALRLADALHNLVENTRFCSQCFNVTEQDPCPICADPARDHGLLCVVEEPLDLLALERTEQYRGVFHVLNGALSPMEGIFAEDLRIKELELRLQQGQIREVILATNPTSEGDYTAAYLLGRLKGLPVRITRLGRGLPVGGDLEYADAVTLTRALESRQEL
ncbi:MAG TPA: recombination mediator RecR [Anaerolineae bacterium]|nr:recombination protein RecR [Anaerolineae bacterium]HOV49083.1 recombination mediator RecR [Anaerolineae bacterium]HPD40329.1 recombination mediator RecR [Anaerolineae bacterium]HRU94983.1 recombination mediator RecR [Anaerolineae bacterium]HXK42938.1 recombination mediator RecR [Anaerolineae bacterium]